MATRRRVGSAHPRSDAADRDPLVISAFLRLAFADDEERSAEPDKRAALASRARSSPRGRRHSFALSSPDRTGLAATGRLSPPAPPHPADPLERRRAAARRS